MTRSPTSKVYKELFIKRPFRFSQQKIDDLILRGNLDDLTKKQSLDKIVSMQNVLDRQSENEGNSKRHLDILHLLYARISNSKDDIKHKYISRVLNLLKSNAKRFSEAIQGLVTSDKKSSERFINLTNKIAKQLDDLEPSVLNAYLQNAINSKGVKLESQIGGKTLNQILIENEDVTASTKRLASEILNFQAPEVVSIKQRRSEELKDFKVINLILRGAALVAFFGITSGIVISNMLLLFGSLLLFISFWGAAYFNKSVHDIHIKEIDKEKGLLFLNESEVKHKDNKRAKRSKEIDSLRKLIRLNHIEFEKNLSKYQKYLRKYDSKQMN